MSPGNASDITNPLGSSFVSEIPVGNIPAKLNEGKLLVVENEDGNEEGTTKAPGTAKEVLQSSGKSSDPKEKSVGTLSENKKEGAVLGRLLVKDGIVVEKILSISVLHKSL